MKKILFALSIAAVLLAGVSCKKDNVKPEYAALLRIWEECSEDGSFTYDLMSISDKEVVWKYINKSSFELDEVMYNDRERYDIHSITKIQTNVVDSDVWAVCWDKENYFYIFDVTDETAKIAYHPLEQEPDIFLLRTLKTGLKLTWHYVPRSAYDLGLSVYWADFDMQTTFKTGFNPENDYFGNWVYSGSTAFYSPGKLYTFPESDPVQEAFGGKWRMPTAEEWNELFENCSWGQTTHEELSFPLMIVRGKKPGYEDQFITFPMNGYIYNNTRQYEGQGYFWSSDKSSANAHYCARIENNQQYLVSMGDDSQVAIRPVWDPNME